MNSIDDIQALVTKYKELLGLEEWELKIIHGTKDDDSYAEVNYALEYLKADIRINLQRIKSHKDLRRTIIHELLHLVLAPYVDIANSLAPEGLRQLLNTHEELLVTRLERLNIWK